MLTRNQSDSADRGPLRIIMLLGAPGSGKGTQSALLAAQPGVIAISTGAMLREEAKHNTPAGFHLRQTLATGALVDDRIVCNAVASAIRAYQNTPRAFHGTSRSGIDLILDGFPRTVAQARMLARLLDGLGLPVPLVLHLDVPSEVLRRRLSSRRQCATCGAIYNLATGRSASGSRCQFDGGALVERDDDSEGVVARRLAAFDAETLPVLDYYRSRDCGRDTYHRIDGNRSVGDIANEVRDILGLAVTAVAA